MRRPNHALSWLQEFVGPSGCKGITAMTLEHCRVPQTLLLSSLNNRVNVCFRVENLWAGEENGEEGKEWRSRVAFRVCETYSDEEDSYSDEARRVRAHLNHLFRRFEDRGVVLFGVEEWAEIFRCLSGGGSVSAEERNTRVGVWLLRV